MSGTYTTVFDAVCQPSIDDVDCALLGDDDDDDTVMVRAHTLTLTHSD